MYSWKTKFGCLAMVFRVSTTRGTTLFFHSRLFFTLNSNPFSALAASNEGKHTAGKAPYLCRDLNTGSHPSEAPCNSGGDIHSPPHRGLRRDTAVHAIPLKTVKKEGDDAAKPNVCIQNYVKLSASTVKRKKGRSSCGDVKVSQSIDAHGHSSDKEVKVSESNAMTLSKASRRKRHASDDKDLKISKSSAKHSHSKASRKTAPLSYDQKVSELEACIRDADGHSREGNAKILTCEVCRQEAQGRFGDGEAKKDAKCNPREGNSKILTCEACKQDAQGHFGDHEDAACKNYAQSAELQSPSSSKKFVVGPVTQGQEELSSSGPCVPSRDNCESRHTVKYIYGFAATSTPKSKENCMPSHVPDASSRMVYPSLSLEALLKKMECSQIVMLDLQRKVELLKAKKMSDNDVARLLRGRAFKHASFKHLSAVLQVLQKFFVTSESACQALVNNSKFLVHPVEVLQQTLKVLADFHIEKETASRLFACYQAPLFLNGELLQERLTFFKELGLTVEALNTICCRSPRILSIRTDSCVQFLESTGFSRNRLLRLLQRRSRILSFSVDDLRKKGEYFRQLGLSAQNLCVAFENLSQISIEKLQVHLQSLKKLGFSDNDVQLLIRRQPSLLGMIPESVQARFDYLVHEQNRDMAEIVRCPSCLMLSLHGRIIPRFLFIEKLRVSKVYSLSTILCRTDAKFKSTFGKIEEVE